LHVAKVADHSDDRIGREDDFEIVLEDDRKSSRRPTPLGGEGL